MLSALLLLKTEISKNMNIEFKYSDIISQAQMLAAFEGRDYVNSNGESMFSSVVITTQDRPFIQTYIMQALQALGERFARMIQTVQQDDTALAWTLRTSQTRHPDAQSEALIKHLNEAVVSYVMMNWLAERKPNRVAMYTDLWNGSSQLAERNIFRKAPPIRKKKNYADIDEVTITVV